MLAPLAESMATAPTIRIHVIREEQHDESVLVCDLANALTERDPVATVARMVIDRLRAMPEAVAQIKADEIERRFSPAIERADREETQRMQLGAEQWEALAASAIVRAWNGARSSRGATPSPAMALGEAAHRQALEDTGYSEYSFADVARRYGPRLAPRALGWYSIERPRHSLAEIAEELGAAEYRHEIPRWGAFMGADMSASPDMTAPAAATAPAPAQCPDCRGTRVYEGLFSRGPCLTCSGGAA